MIEFYPWGRARPGANEMTGTFLTATVVEEHSVATGETLAGIAAGAGMSWKELAEFNWGTSQPKEINRFLRDVVGCTKMTANRKNYVFDDFDDPGIVLVPVEWKETGWRSTGATPSA